MVLFYKKTGVKFTNLLPEFFESLSSLPNLSRVVLKFPYSGYRGKPGVRISNHIENLDIECPVIEAGMYIWMQDSRYEQKSPDIELSVPI